MRAPDITAIVVNYNAGAFLQKCVDSLLNCPLQIEIIVVDNRSQDGSVDALTSTENFLLIRNARNVGFAAACNIGIARAEAPHLLFLNPDCFFEPGTLSRLLDCLLSEDKVGMVGAYLANEDGTEQGGGRRAVPTPWRSFVRATGLHRLQHRWPRLFYDFYLHKQPLPAGPIEVEAISGACMLVRRSAIDEVGIWDENYFLHCEDLDWCLRFRQHGWQILFVPDAWVTHALGVCSSSRPIFVEWHKHKGMLRFYGKFFRHQYPGPLMGLVAVGVAAHFVVISAVKTIRGIGAKVKS